MAQARERIVILGEPGTASNGPEGRATLDQLFRRAAVRRPDTVALADPPHREDFTDGPPRRVSYAEADRAISAIAAKLRRLGLQTDSVVALQLPNTVESVLALLGVLRAGMIAAPLPLLWRRAEVATALGRVGARMIVTAARIGEADHGAIAMQAAAENFQVRHVGAFGTRLADGIVPLDGLLAAQESESPPPIEREGNPAEHVAVVTFDVAPGGPVAVARSHRALIAGGRATVLEGLLWPDSTLLGCIATSTFAGLSLSVLPWLLSGGKLCLHHGFDAAAFAAQMRDEACDTIALPAVVAPRLVSAGLLDGAPLRSVLALWRTPERPPAGTPWRHARANFVDMLAFGETALIGRRRGLDGEPTPMPGRTVRAPRGSADAAVVAELSRTPTGTLAVRGPMVPTVAFPPGSERLDTPHLRADAAGFVDTRYPCRLDLETDTLTVTGPPPGVVSVGGYRCVLGELEALVRHAHADATLAALPDSLVGHRLAGSVAGAQGLDEVLAALGTNALVADAFRERNRRAA